MTDYVDLLKRANGVESFWMRMSDYLIRDLAAALREVLAERDRLRAEMLDWRERAQRIDESTALLVALATERAKVHARVLAVDGEGGEGEQQLRRIADLERQLAAERARVAAAIELLEPLRTYGSVALAHAKLGPKETP